MAVWNCQKLIQGAFGFKYNKKKRRKRGGQKSNVPYPEHHVNPE